MKKSLFKLTITFIAVGILVSSCSLTKRHYTSGYYVSHNSDKQIVKTQEKKAQAKTNPSLYAVQNEIAKNNLDYSSNQNPIAENGAVTASNKQVAISNPITNKPTKHYVSNTVIPTPAPVKKNIVSTSTKKVVHDSGDPGLSLFWIIILILLILWALGLLTGGWGLGGFIYILLVLALILLILWLLRII